MKRMRIVERARKSLVGRAICRLLGEERGAVMMEYVIVAGLIAAAAALVVISRPFLSSPGRNAPSRITGRSFAFASSNAASYFTESSR